MKCSYCKNDSIYFAKYFGKYFCKRHLENYLFKKLKRNLHKYHLIQKDDKLLLENLKSPVGTACIHLFTKAIKTWPVKIVQKNENKKINFSTIEDETKNIIENLTNKKIYKTFFQEGKVIKPFRNFSREELFILGVALGSPEKEKIKKTNHPTDSLGTATKLNLIHLWDRILALK